NNALSGGPAHDAAHLFPPLNDAAFLAAAAGTPSIGILHDPAVSADDSTIANVAASIDAGSLFSSPALVGSPAFWDLSGSGLQHQMQQATLSTTPVTANTTTVHMAAAVAAAMGMNNNIGAMTSSAPSSASSTSTTVAIYPQTSTQTAMPVWDDVAAQTLSNVLGSPEMLMQFAQPSPTPTITHYNLSAHPTPAFDTCSAPPHTGQFGAFALATTMVSAAGGTAAVCPTGQSHSVSVGDEGL
ncbi:hypothetical protein LPJ64_002806, partial [Coemansia asiatica]